MSLAQVGIRGAYFTSIALGFRQVVSLATTFFVARQLLPSDIGVFSMVMVVVGLAQVVGDVGIATGLVRSQKNSSTVLSTCFWINAGIGAILMSLIMLLAPVAGWFYERADVAPYLRVSAIGLFVNFMLPVPMALMQQRLAFKGISITQATGSLVGAFITIALVYAGFGVWGLVCQPIIGNLVILTMLAAFSKWRPTLEFNLASAKDILISGMHLLGASITGYVRNTFDVIIIGKNLSAQDLGIYGMAQTILYAPMHLITSTVARVIFPLIAKVKDDLERLQDAVLTATARTALLIFPLYFGLFALTDEFVMHVFGPNWSGMVPLIRIMAISFLIQSIANVAGPLMLALNKSKIILIMSIGNAVVYFSILLALIPYGLMVIATGYAIANSIIALTSLGISLHFARISYRNYIKSIIKPFFMALAMVMVIIKIRFEINTSSFLNFIILIVFGIITYTVLVVIFERAALNQVMMALKSKSTANPS